MVGSYVEKQDSEASVTLTGYVWKSESPDLCEATQTFGLIYGMQLIVVISQGCCQAYRRWYLQVLGKGCLIIPALFWKEMICIW